MSRRGRVSVRILVVGLVPVLALVALLAASFGRDPRAVPSVLEGSPAPAFTLVDLDGREVSLEAIDGPVVLNFWSTWCGPCKQEHSTLLQAASIYGPEGVTFLGVVYNDEADKATRYLARAGSAYPHLIDPTGRTAISYGVAGVPETYFITRDRQVRTKYVGPLTPQTLTAQVEPLLTP